MAQGTTGAVRFAFSPKALGKWGDFYCNTVTSMLVAVAAQQPSVTARLLPTRLSGRTSSYSPQRADLTEGAAGRRSQAPGPRSAPARGGACPAPAHPLPARRACGRGHLLPRFFSQQRLEETLGESKQTTWGSLGAGLGRVGGNSLGSLCLLSACNTHCTYHKVFLEVRQICIVLQARGSAGGSRVLKRGGGGWGWD